MNYFKEIEIKKEPFTFDNSSGEDNHHSDKDNEDDDDDPGSRCGEIFVANNAQTWTFVCTFCDKSMRKIDDFIDHIQNAHVNLPPPLPVELIESSHINDNDDDEDDNENDNDNISEASTETKSQDHSRKHSTSQFNSLDRSMTEYVDYNDFLDVNVTVPEVILSETNGRVQVSKPKSSESSHVRIKTEPESDKYDHQQQQQQNKETRPIPMQLTSSRGPGLISQPVAIQALARPRKQRKERKSRLRRKQIKGPAFCQICERTFQYHSLYRNHMVKHTSETPFQCTVCKKGFKSKQAIRYHMSTHQRQKPFQCELCQSGFYHEWQFVAHMETHRSENRHPCEVCGKVNRTKFDKDLHMRTHTGDRPFGCEFCMKRFRLRHHLSNHLKLHLTYRCDYCRKQFSNGVPMKKPYTCQDCSGTANTLPILNDTEKDDDEEAEESDEYEDIKDESLHPTQSPQHLEAINPNTCKVCNKTFVNKRGLGVHISTKHQNILY